MCCLNPFDNKIMFTSSMAQLHNRLITEFTFQLYAYYVRLSLWVLLSSFNLTFVSVISGDQYDIIQSFHNISMAQEYAQSTYHKMPVCCTGHALLDFFRKTQHRILSWFYVEIPVIVQYLYILHKVQHRLQCGARDTGKIRSIRFALEGLTSCEETPL